MECLVQKMELIAWVLLIQTASQKGWSFDFPDSSLIPDYSSITGSIIIENI